MVLVVKEMDLISRENVYRFYSGADINDFHMLSQYVHYQYLSRQRVGLPQWKYTVR